MYYRIKKANGSSESEVESPSMVTPGEPEGPIMVPPGDGGTSGAETSDEFTNEPASEPSPSKIGETESGYPVYQHHYDIKTNPIFQETDSGERQMRDLDDITRDHQGDLFDHPGHAREVSDWFSQEGAKKLQESKDHSSRIRQRQEDIDRRHKPRVEDYDNDDEYGEALREHRGYRDWEVENDRKKEEEALEDMFKFFDLSHNIKNWAAVEDLLKERRSPVNKWQQESEEALFERSYHGPKMSVQASK